MLIRGIPLGLVLRLRAAAVALRFGTEAARGAGIDIVEALRLPLLVGAFAILLVALWVNRTYPGLSLAFLGVLANGLVILVNGGYMPVWGKAGPPAGLVPGGAAAPG